MLPVSDLAIFALGAATVLAVPGPTNTLLAAAGLQQGLRRSLKLTGAEAGGYLVSITFWGRFLAQATQTLPWLPPVVRMACGLYIAWLAVRMWQAAAALDTDPPASFGMRDLFVATLLNPKGILFGGTIFPVAAFTSLQAYLQAMVTFLVVLVPIGSLWIAFGAQVAADRLGWLKPVHVQRCASVVLGVFSLSLAWTVFR
jgi:threonine/homoserine/homoserine lactone efflux protein